jgi:hypothetical protein
MKHMLDAVALSPLGPPQKFFLRLDAPGAEISDRQTRRLYECAAGGFLKRIGAVALSPPGTAAEVLRLVALGAEGF